MDVGRLTVFRAPASQACLQTDQQLDLLLFSALNGDLSQQLLGVIRSSQITVEPWISLDPFLFHLRARSRSGSTVGDNTTGSAAGAGSSGLVYRTQCCGTAVGLEVGYNRGKRVATLSFVGALGVLVQHAG
jgi:hypothetical protein